MGRFPTIGKGRAGSPDKQTNKLSQALPQLDRRQVLIGGGVGLGLLVGFALWPRDYPANVPVGKGEALFNPFVKIGKDGVVTVIVPQTEYGQGVTTALPQILADELGADWRTIAVSPAPIHPAYTNNLLVNEDAELVTPRALVPHWASHMRATIVSEMATRDATMLTGGSTSLRVFEARYREAGAAARILLQMTAADQWGVDWEECQTSKGFVIHGKERVRFADIAESAAHQKLPSAIIYRAPGPDGLYGKEVPRLDAPAKVDGSAQFAADIRVPGMVYAAIRHGPLGETRLQSIDRIAAKKQRGVIDVIEAERWVAVLASNWWAANQALELLAPVFVNQGPLADSAAIAKGLKQALTQSGTRMAERGDVNGAFAGRPLVNATYEVAPALHAPLETRSATAVLERDHLRLWVATQAPAQCRLAVARATGIREADITLFPMLAGGSFGIGFEHDIAVEAAILTQKSGKPVQLIWSRAEEAMQDRPRAPARAKMTATLDTAFNIHGLRTAIAAPPTYHEWEGRVFDGKDAITAMQDGIGRDDAHATQGAMPLYAIPHVGVDYYSADVGLPTGHMRGQADGYSCFFTECFVDEMAAKSPMDPLSYRMQMLVDQPAMARCLTQAAMIGEWEGGAPGIGQGLACHAMRGSMIAVMISAQPTERGLRIERIAAAVDAGRVVNPSLVRQQIEGGLLFGLATALGGSSQYTKGIVDARDLASLRLPHLAQSPEIRVNLLPSNRAPGGISELGVPAVAPALANAYYKATGQRMRRLPFSLKPIT